MTVSVKGNRLSSRDLALTINRILQGGLNNVGDIILSESNVETRIRDSRIGGNSVLLLMPVSANAAAAQSAIYVSAVSSGEAVIIQSSPAADRRFKYAVFG